MIKNFFFYGCFLFLLAISVVSCRNEYDAVIQNEKPQTYTVVHNNTTQVNQNATLSAKLNSFRQGSENSKNSSYLDAYEIFETQVTYVKNNDKDRESYAFYIKDKNLPTDKFHVKNLVFSKLSSETIYSVKLVSYYLPDGINENSKNILVENVEVLNPETGLPNKNVNGKSAGCGAEVIEIEHWCGAHLHYGAGAAADCHDDDKPYSTWIVLLGNCDGGGQGGGSGDHNDGPANPGGPGGGTGSGGNGGNPVDTGLSLPPTCQSGDCDVILANKINDILGSILNFEEMTWLVDNDFTAQSIYTSLLNNNTQSNKDYLSVRIKFLMRGSDINISEFQNLFLNGNSIANDKNLNSSNSIVFNSGQDFKNALISKNANLIKESSIISENGDEKIVSAKVKRTGIWNSGEEIRIKLKKLNNIWEFDSVTSSEYGLTLGAWTFTQIDYTKNVNNPIITVEVNGYENYNLFIEGIGTYYKDKVKIKVKINNTNGNIISIEFIDL